MNSASLCSLAGQYDNLILTRFLAAMDCLKIPAQIKDESRDQSKGKLSKRKGAQAMYYHWLCDLLVVGRLDTRGGGRGGNLGVLSFNLHTEQSRTRSTKQPPLNM